MIILIIVILGILITLFASAEGYREVMNLCRQLIEEMQEKLKELGFDYTTWKWKDYKKHWYW